ncbi:MAG: sodium/proline symporter [Clostridia bacterium]|nr:sodium/proline symporter [Clostridia bacterium]
MRIGELIAFILYFTIVLGMGVYFFIRGKDEQGEKSFFLGGRKMGGFVAALSAGASDMSAWVLMGLPGSIYLAGMGQVWISVGLLIGTILAWFLVAPRLRRYSMLADDSITIPQYLTKRFKSSSSVLQVVCAVIFVIVYCVYGASSINACGSLLNTLFGLDSRVGMAIATAIIIVYVFMGGFNAVCWTDFFQGMLMLAALMITPIVAVGMLNASGAVAAGTIPENYYNFLATGKFDWVSVATILTGLGWGLGYFGMPHIIVRYISIRSEKEMKKSRVIGIMWTTLILLMASVVGIVGRKFLGDSMIGSKNLVFVQMARTVFPVFLGGIIISAIIAASMSTADSQLLAASSAFASDVYKTSIKKNASDKNVMWVGRIVVIVISLLALGIALLGAGGDAALVPAFSTIMGLVSAAWGAFGAAFGPVILLSLFWKRLNYKGAVSGIVTGFVVDILWMILFNFEYYDMKSVAVNTNLYEILPGFVAGMTAAIVVSLLTEKPSKEVSDLFDRFKGLKSLEESDLAENAVKEEI